MSFRPKNSSGTRRWNISQFGPCFGPQKRRWFLSQKPRLVLRLIERAAGRSDPRPGATPGAPKAPKRGVAPARSADCPRRASGRKTPLAFRRISLRRRTPGRQLASLDLSTEMSTAEHRVEHSPLTIVLPSVLPGVRESLSLCSRRSTCAKKIARVLLHQSA